MDQLERAKSSITNVLSQNLGASLRPPAQADAYTLHKPIRLKKPTEKLVRS